MLAADDLPPTVVDDEPDEGPEVGVSGLEVGVDGFSRSSIFFADGVLALLLVPLLGEWGGASFVFAAAAAAAACIPAPLNAEVATTPLLSRPFSRGEVAPFTTGLVGPSLASSTTRS